MVLSTIQSHDIHMVLSNCHMILAAGTHVSVKLAETGSRQHWKMDVHSPSKRPLGEKNQSIFQYRSDYARKDITKPLRLLHRRINFNVVMCSSVYVCLLSFSVDCGVVYT